MIRNRRANPSARVRSAWFSLVTCGVIVGIACAGADARPGDGPNGSILIPAFAFDRGNVDTQASGGYADAEPVVINGGKLPNTMEYDIEFPIEATYTLHVRYAAQQVRSVDICLDGQKRLQGFKSTTGSWQSSTAIWEQVGELEITADKHTVKLECPGPCIPHIVALRLDASKPFPKGWKLNRPGARKLDSALGQIKGYDNGKDGYEAFVREDGFVNVPDDYNPIIRFERRPAPAPAAERILEYALMGEGKYSVQAKLVRSDREDADGWVAELSVKIGDQQSESAVLPLAAKQIGKMIDHTLRLVADFRETESPDYLEAERDHAIKLRDTLDASAKETVTDDSAGQRVYQLYLDAFQLKNRVALSNSLLRFGRLLFAKRQTYDTSHIYTTYFDGSHRFGGNLVLLTSLRPDAEPHKIVSELGDNGIYRDLDVSWDGQRVLFSFKAGAESPCHIYEIGVDGSGMRQLTNSPFDDIDPVYLPDGRIMFISTRGGRVVLCHNAFTVSVLHTMDADGSNVQCVSRNTVNEFTPSVGADGQVLYTRWEYVDKNVGNNQSLWRARPDGTFASHVAGAHWGPITFWEPRQIPGSDRIVCTLAPHMPIAVGPIAIIDPHDVDRSPAKFTNLTPELPPPHHFAWHRNDVGYYCNPFPLSEKYFIVSYSYDADPRAPRGYGLYLLDRWGNRDLIYRDPTGSCFEAMPAVARPKPPVLPSAYTFNNSPLSLRVPWRTLQASEPTLAASATKPSQIHGAAVRADGGERRVAAAPRPPELGLVSFGRSGTRESSDRKSHDFHYTESTGTFLVLDVYDGLTGVSRGEVKYLRVIEEVPKPVSADCSGYGLQHPLISQNGDFAVKRLLGTVPVESDGSAYFEAPAEKALYFSALDENFMEVQRMRSFVHLAPGQAMTCVGCHEDRRSSPPNTIALASLRPPSAIEPPPEGSHAPDFYHDVQPVLNRHCGNCHSGDRLDGGVDLSADFTNLFSVAYETLVPKYVSYVNIYSSAALAVRPPKYYGSHASPVIATLGKHKEDGYVELPKDDLRRIAEWIDLNAPYYGTYRYSRPGTIGGRELVSRPLEEPLQKIFQDRCSSCHANDPTRIKRIRYPNIERSPALLAPLAKEAGGTGRCGKQVFADKSDSYFEALLATLRLLDAEVKQNPREDMWPERPPIADEKAPYRYR